MKKPTILLAKKGTSLPFDVAGFRVLFYEDSIGGKKKLEDGLRRHIDAILTAAEAHTAGCPFCGGSLHSARYPRKPRGGPEDLGPDYATRLSFCCAADGCRRRTTPPSVRYLGRRVYLGAVVVLVTALLGGITATRAAQLREWLGVNVRTLKRWRVWWREAFVASPFWRGAQGRFMPPVMIEALPASLLERFAGDARTRLRHALVFLAPLTTRRGDRRAGSPMAGGDPQRMRLVPARRRS